MDAPQCRHKLQRSLKQHPKKSPFPVYKFCLTDMYRNPSERDNVEVDLKPEIKIVREPEPQYVLVIETSSSLDDYGQWKWINKATQKFIRYDLPLNSNLAIVTFSNTSKVPELGKDRDLDLPRSFN